MKIVVTFYLFIVAILFATVSWSHDGNVENAHKGVGISYEGGLEERITEEGLSEFGVWVPIDEGMRTPFTHGVNGFCTATRTIHGVCHKLRVCFVAHGSSCPACTGFYIEEC